MYMHTMTAPVTELDVPNIMFSPKKGERGKGDRFICGMAVGFWPRAASEQPMCAILHNRHPGIHDVKLETAIEAKARYKRAMA